MRKVIQKDSLIQGEGAAFPYTVVSDLAEVGVICKAADGAVIILQHSDITATVSYMLAPVLPVVVESAVSALMSTDSKKSLK